MNGLMARTRAEVEELNWDLNAGTAHVKIRSDIDQKITLTSGIPWKSAIVEGADAAIKAGKEIQLSLKAGDTVTVAFSQSADVYKRQPAASSTPQAISQMLRSLRIFLIRPSFN